MSSLRAHIPAAQLPLSKHRHCKRKDSNQHMRKDHFYKSHLWNCHNPTVNISIWNKLTSVSTCLDSLCLRMNHSKNMTGTHLLSWRNNKAPMTSESSRVCSRPRFHWSFTVTVSHGLHSFRDVRLLLFRVYTAVGHNQSLSYREGTTWLFLKTYFNSAFSELNASHPRFFRYNISSIFRPRLSEGKKSTFMW